MQLMYGWAWQNDCATCVAAENMRKKLQTVTGIVKNELSTSCK